MNHGSLFSGIGGFDLAAEEVGWNNVFHCEIEPFPRKILNYYWPKAISYEDIKTTDFSVHRGQIDILTGGFPCQPYSVAGSRKGTEDDRHLWPEMLRAIRELTPSWIVGENVPGIISWNGGLVFEEVCIDLENEGYEVQPIVLPAASVNAPHKRDRVWFVAFNSKCQSNGRYNTRESERIRLEMEQDQLDKTRRNKSSNNTKSSSFNVAKDASYSTSYGSHDEPPTKNIKNRQNNKQSRERWIGATKGLSDEQYATNAGLFGQEKCEQQAARFGQRGGWETFPTQPPVCGGDDGLPSELDGITFPKWRNESIKGYGNAVVPQVVVEIFKVIEEMHKTKIHGTNEI